MTLATIVALTAPIADAAAKQERSSRPAEMTAPRAAGEPIMAIVSIKSQQVTFYDADGWITRAPVSTGTKGRETPAGVFAVIEKEKEHYSTMYDDASMPHMQRITWNGIALHGGPLPGYAASHGCIRMPFSFAERQFDKTRIGMRVIISPNDAEPVEFSHPALPVPNQEALTAAPAKAEAIVREAAEAARIADEAKKAAAKAPREIAALNSSLRKAESLKKNADAELASADKAIAAAEQAGTRASEQKQKAGARAAELATQLDTARADTKPKIDALLAAKDAAAKDREGKKVAAAAAREAASLTASLQKLETLKKNADAELVAAEKAIAAVEQAKMRAEDLKQKAIAKTTELTIQLDAAKADTQPKLDALAATKDAAKAAEKKKPTQPKRRPKRSSRLSRFRSTSAARRGNSTSAAIRTNRRRTAAAKYSTRASKCPSRSAIPTSESAHTYSRRWQRAMQACAGQRSRSMAPTTRRARSTASPFRRKCWIASDRPHCRDPRSSSRTSHSAAKPITAPNSSWC